MLDLDAGCDGDRVPGEAGHLAPHDAAQLSAAPGHGRLVVQPPHSVRDVAAGQRRLELVHGRQSGRHHGHGRGLRGCRGRGGGWAGRAPALLGGGQHLVLAAQQRVQDIRLMTAGEFVVTFPFIGVRITARRERTCLSFFVGGLLFFNILIVMDF